MASYAAARQLGERRAAAHQVEELVDVARRRARWRRRPAGRARRAGWSGTRSDSMAPARIRSTATAVWARSPRCLGNSTPRRDLADLVAGAADALQGAGDARRRLDLDDQVDRAHVDAELEAAGGDHAGEPAALEVVLDERALLLGDRAVVGLGDDRPRRPCAGAGLGHDLGRAARRSVSGRSPPARSVAISLSRAVSRSASRRELAKTIVERCCSIRSTTCSSTCGQIELARAAGRRRPRRTRSGAVMSSTGTTT